MFRQQESAAATPAASTDERSNSIWSILPSFDPACDDPREYVDKVKFLHGICPARDKPMLGPRLAMLMKGTACAQIKAADTAKLADPDTGIEVLLSAVATWEESAELQTYEKFEKALYRIVQRNDETIMSYVNRLNVAFQDLGEVQVKDMKAFILLRQSALVADDKRKVIVMTQDKLAAEKIEQSMRSLYTRILGAGSTGETKKRVYPVNYVDDEADEINVMMEEDHMDEEQILQAMAENGDEDAQVIQDFEEQLVEVCQESPDLSLCFSAYSEARGRLRDKLKSRGFWPAKGRGKTFKKGFGGKSGGKRRQSLADRIASSHCRLCGQKGHWKWECPKKSSSSNPTNAEVNVAFEVQSGSCAEEIVMDPPDTNMQLSLNELIYGNKDRNLGHLRLPPFEHLEIQNGYPTVNEEFIL
jgi:hypothetical protein